MNIRNLSVITEPGLYELPSREYHADPCPEPSISNSIIRILLAKSPLHAMWAHPRLTPEPPPRDEPTPAMTDGTILHRLILTAGEEFEVIDAADWRKNATKEAGAEARAAGRVPVLAPAFGRLQRVANGVRDQIYEHPACRDFFEPSWSEPTLAWKVGDLWCRALVDRVTKAPGGAIYDLKSTGLSAAPDDFRRKVEHYATQAVWYRMAAAAVLGGEPRPFRFVAFETEAPYAVSVLELGDTMAEIAQADILRAMKLWARCLIEDDWPGYGSAVHYVEAPPHMQIRLDMAEAA